MGDERPARDGVPFVDLKRGQSSVEPELRGAFELCVERGDFVLGEEVGLFEEAFAEYVGTDHCVGVASGTAALTIALTALGIGPGDEVIVPAHTFIASALPVLHVGAEPVFCDVDESRGLIDLASADAVVSERTVAVMPVHLYGQACDMPAIAQFASRRGLAVIEDAAQAHGASWAGARAGSDGTVSAFSFYPSKNLGALGDGGAICTRDAGIAERARELRNLGQLTKGMHNSAGFNERLDTLQAAFLRIKLSHLDGWNDERRGAAARYAKRLPIGIGPSEAPFEAHDVFHLFPVRVLPDRDGIARALKARGIGTGVHYAPAVHEQPPLNGARRAGLATAEGWAREELSLPMFPGIRDDEVDYVCDVLGELL